MTRRSGTRSSAGKNPEVPQNVLDGTARLRASDRVVVHGEIVESLWEEDFTSVEDTQIVDDLRERLKLLGLDASKAEEMVRMAQQAPMRKGAAAQPFPVQPQREWEEARRRTQEQEKRLANILLNHVELTQAGTELVYKYKSLKLTGKSNYICAPMMVNKEIERRLGKERAEASLEEFRGVLYNIDDLLKTLVRRVRKAKVDYDKENA